MTEYTKEELIEKFKLAISLLECVSDNHEKCMHGISQCRIDSALSELDFVDFDD